MYAGFNLTFSKEFFCKISNQPSERYHHYTKIGRGTLQKIPDQKLDDYINRFFNNNTILDANHIQEDWFPCIDADVFISHSHDDKYLVEALAGWLYEDMGISVFIDSDVWGYADTLLEQINDKYSNKRWDGTGYVYDHEKCNRVYPNKKHIEKSIAEQLKQHVDYGQLPANLGDRLAKNTKGAYLVLKINTDRTKNLHPLLFSLFGKDEYNRRKVLIKPISEIKKFEPLLKNLDISAFKVVVP